MVAGPVAKAIENGFLIDIQKPAFEIYPHSLAQHAVDVLRRKGGGHEDIGDFIGHRLGG
jgi:hypothetical protein